MVRPESNSRRPAWQPDAQPTEPPVRGGSIIHNYSLRWRWSSWCLPNREAAREISTTFTNTEGNNCFSICHTSWKNSTKNYFICDDKLKYDRFLEFRMPLDVRRWIQLDTHPREQSARAKKHDSLTSVVYTNANYEAYYRWSTWRLPQWTWKQGLYAFPADSSPCIDP